MITLITAITAMVLPLDGLEAMGLLLLSCTSLLWLGDVSMTLSELLSVAGRATSWSLAIPVGVALIELGGVNFDCLMACSKFNSNFLVLPDRISYLLSE